MTIEQHKFYRRRHCDDECTIHKMYVCINELEMVHEELHKQLMCRHKYYECNLTSCKRSHHTMYENDKVSGLGHDCVFCKKEETQE